MIEEPHFLEPHEVKFLSFEGGGGKGNAFLGAIKGLQELSILSHQEERLLGPIEGISGASAGAITALFLSTGYTYEEMFDIVSRKNFNDFFDFSPIGVRVEPDGKSILSIPGVQNNFKNNSFSKWLARQLNKKLIDVLPSIIFEIISKILMDYLLKENPELATRLHKNKRHALNSLIYDQGVFAGIKIHEFLNDLITLKVAKILKGRSAPLNHFWTFEEHYHYFKKDLRFTAVNLETKKVHILSKDTTPRLPVATAVRMSMSLPLVFKPVILTKDYIWKKQMEPFWEGVWVDGGLFDNTPIRTFNSDKSLLFRLGDTERTKIESLGSFLKAWLVYVGVFGSGSGQVTETTYKYYQTSVIELNIDSTSLLKFNLDKTSLEKLTKANSRITRSYFARTTLPN